MEHHQQYTKLTVNLPAGLIEGMVKNMGISKTELVRRSLERERHRWACEELLKLRGKFTLDIDLGELRNNDREFQWL